MAEPKIIIPTQDIKKIPDTQGSDDDDEDEQYKAPPKTFLASSLAESLFNGLLQKIRHRGIPRQKGFLHLNRVTGYGSAASTNKLSNNGTPPKFHLQQLVRSTVKLTRQAIQQACEKERQKKLRAYHQDGIPRYRPFIDFLDEFKHLVREAERQDRVDVSKKRTKLESSWTNIMEEIRNKGLLKTINQQVEAQRMDTIYSTWNILRNKTDRGENAAMATVHKARCVAQEELKDAVKKMRERAKADDEAMTNYYADLKDQMLTSLSRRILVMHSAKQVNVDEINSEMKTRLELDKELKDDPIRKKATTARQELHKELKHIYALVMEEEKQKKCETISQQEKLKEAVLKDVVHTYRKKKTFAEIARNKLEQIKEEQEKGNAKDPQKDLVKGVWAQFHKDAARKAKQEKALKT